MARGWKSVALTAVWLGLCASVQAQPQPVPAAGPAPAATSDQQGAPVPHGTPDHGKPGHGLPDHGFPGPPGCDVPMLPRVPVVAPFDGPGPYVPTFQFGAEYLYWIFRKQSSQPPLVTQGPVTEAVPASLGLPTTVVLNRGDREDTRHSGMRFNFGIGTNDYSRDWSVGGSFFVIERQDNVQRFSSNGAPGSLVLGRPFFNVVAQREDTDPAAIPGLAAGGIQINTPRLLYGGDVALRCHLSEVAGGQFVPTIGFRFLSLQQTLGISMTSIDIPGLGAPGNTYYLNEQFHALNRFWLAQFGAEYDFFLGPFAVTSVLKVGVGTVNQTQENKAFTQITEANGTVTQDTDAALLIGPGNAGSFSRSRLAIVPEAQVKLGYNFNEHVGISVGYSILYTNSVILPGDQVDRRVNLQPVGTGNVFQPANPPPSFRSAVFWAQGIDAGIRFSF